VTDALERQLIAHEALKLKPYVDTKGKLTIGVGHNLTDRGLTRDQCLMIFRDDVKVAISELIATFPWFETLDETRQAVLVDMNFNMGLPTLKGFRKMLWSLQKGRYADAAVHMLDSDWADQVGNRALTLAAMMETGINPFTVTRAQGDGDDGA
jgi:lysozyme